MLDDRNIQRNSEGYLLDPESWKPALAQEIAAESGLELSEAHWRILAFMREYLYSEGVVPDVRHVVDHLVQTTTMDKKQAKEHLFKLFPYGYMQQACKIAGFQRPRAWSTG